MNTLNKTMNEAKFSETASDIQEVCQEICELLIQKNESYGDSALNPNRIFSKADTMEQIRVRMDDKLNRVMKGNGNQFGEDLELDLLGYLILHRIARKRNEKSKFDRTQKSPDLA